MKRSFTIVLTLAAAVSAMIGKPAAAQVSNATTLIAKGYNASEVATALAPVSQKNGMTPDEQACFDAINSRRISNGLAPLTPDPALAAAARYQVADQLNVRYQGPVVYIWPGGQQQQKAIGDAAVDFGSSVTAVQNYEYNNYFYSNYTGNWSILVYIWNLLDPNFSQFVQDPSVSIGGVAVLDMGLTVAGQHIYEWSLVAGKPAPPAAPAPPPASTVSFFRDMWPGVEEFYTAGAAEQAAVTSFMQANGSLQVYANATDVPGLSPLYRFYDVNSGGHFWTAGESEKNVILQYLPSYHFEGVACYVFAGDGTGHKPMYRAYNTQTGRHLFTPDAAEYNSLGAGWNKEGIGFYTL